MTFFTHETDSMGIINHYQGIVFVSQITDSLQIGNYTVHGEDAVSRNQTDAAVSSFLQFFLQISHVIVLVAETFCLAQTNTVND